ncbi:MAG: 30S ribosomal protein S15 [Planctomycetota bacterium]
MPLPADVKKETIAKLSRSDTDTGSPEVQISILTARIAQVAAHVRDNKQDNHNRRGLVQMVAKRNKLLRYLKRTKPEVYVTTIKTLGLRK